MNEEQDLDLDLEEEEDRTLPPKTYTVTVGDDVFHYEEDYVSTVAEQCSANPEHIIGLAEGEPAEQAVIGPVVSALMAGSRDGQTLSEEIEGLTALVDSTLRLLVEKYEDSTLGELSTVVGVALFQRLCLAIAECERRRDFPRSTGNTRVLALLDEIEGLARFGLAALHELGVCQFLSEEVCASVIAGEPVDWLSLSLSVV